MSSHEKVEDLVTKFTGKILEQKEFRGEFTIIVAREDVHKILLYCRDYLEFDYLVDICSVDNSGEDPRFEMVYEIYSYAKGVHLRIKATVPEDDATIDTVSDIWPTANWHEREVYDMMGLRFNNHPDLRRILMWEGYPYFPLRKEFPLAGKSSDVEEVAFTNPAPLAGGPFVTVPGESSQIAREPRSRE